MFHWAGKQNCDIICIQESHIKTEEKFLNNKKLGEKFVSLIDKEKKRQGDIY